MTAIFAAFAAGLVFGLGLILSGMANPAKVLGFLDVAGAWDPSLAFVMGGAIGVGLVAFFFAGKRARSWLGFSMQLPNNRQIDARLVGGSLAFGVGWGLSGICPGPGLVLVGAGVGKGMLFVAAMLAGMVLFELIQARRRPQPSLQQRPHGT
jgi:uncharacterized membrane protein YedE/YeeE